MASFPEETSRARPVKRKREMSLADAIVLANNLTSKTKPETVEAMYRSLEEGLGSCFPYGANVLKSKVSAEFIHLAPDSLKYRVFMEKRKEQLQLEREALGVIRRKPELYCVPLKQRPVKGGGPEEDGPALIKEFMPRIEELWEKGDERVSWWETGIHWYVIGGQHTYQACTAIAAKEEPGTSRHKFFTEFDVVPVYTRDVDLLIKVTNALNIQVKDKAITENFRSQLRNARAKWIERGRPLPKKAGAKHDAEFKRLVKDYLSPFFGKDVSTSTQKFPLCFVDDATYNKWMDVFDAWEEGKIITEDGSRHDGMIPKIPSKDITMNDVDRTIGLRDSDLIKLADAILSQEVSIKSRKVGSGQMRHGTTLVDWCTSRKRERIIMNELMAEFRDTDLPSKKGDYQEYTDEEWQDLVEEYSITEDVLKYIVTKVSNDSDGSHWLTRRSNQLNPSQRDKDPAPRVFEKAIDKLKRMTAPSTSSEPQAPLANYQVAVARNMKEVLDSLKAQQGDNVQELLVLFCFDPNGESQLLSLEDLEIVHGRLARRVQDPTTESEQSVQDARESLLAPAVIICDGPSSRNVESFAAGNAVWRAHRILYCPKSDRHFQKSALYSRAAVNIFVMYNLDPDSGDEFRSFSEFTGITKELRPYYDDDLRQKSTEWAGGKCSVAFPLLRDLLLPSLKKLKGRVVNCYGGGNVTALALTEGVPIIEFVKTDDELHAANNCMLGMNIIPRARPRSSIAAETDTRSNEGGNSRDEDRIRSASPLKELETADGASPLKELETADGASPLKELETADGASPLKELETADGPRNSPKYAYLSGVASETSA